MKYEPVKDQAERRRILALIERCEKEQMMNKQHMATYINALENRIRELETARPQGEWLEVTSWEAEHHSVTDMRCSICGKYASIVLPHKTRYVYDFCPFCGARMKGADDE